MEECQHHQNTSALLHMVMTLAQLFLCPCAYKKLQPAGMNASLPWFAVCLAGEAV
jgi:hypothetical protein